MGAVRPWALTRLLEGSATSQESSKRACFSFDQDREREWDAVLGIYQIIGDVCNLQRILLESFFFRIFSEEKGGEV